MSNQENTTTSHFFCIDAAKRHITHHGGAPEFSLSAWVLYAEIVIPDATPSTQIIDVYVPRYRQVIIDMDNATRTNVLETSSPSQR